MRSVDTREAITKFSDLLADVEEKGETIILFRDGKPVAELRPYRQERRPLAHDPRLAEVEFREDPSLPLSPEDWPDGGR